MKRQYYNLPKPLTKADYNDCCKLAVEKAKEHHDISSVYLLGGDWLPGISDLDIILVYRNNQSIKPFVSPWSLPGKAKYIFTHRFFSFLKPDFNKYHYIYPKETARLKLLWGEPIELENPQERYGLDAYKDLLQLVVVDVLVNKLLLLPRFVWQKHLNVRQVLGEIYSIKYTAQVWDIISGAQVGREFIEQITDLRLNWFNTDESINLSKLEALILEALDIVWQIVEGLKGLHIDILPEVASNVFLNKKYTVDFVENWQSSQYLDKFKQGYFRKNIFSRKVENYRLQLPGFLSYYFYLYAQGPGCFSQEFKKYWQAPMVTELKVSDINRERISIINDMFNSSLRHGGKFKIPFPYGCSLKNEGVLPRLLVKFLEFRYKFSN